MKASRRWLALAPFVIIWIAVAIGAARGREARAMAGPAAAPAGGAVGTLPTISVQDTTTGGAAAQDSALTSGGDTATSAAPTAAPPQQPQAGAQGQAGEAARLARENVQTPLGARLISIVGMVALLLIGWLFSIDRRAVPWRILIWGITLQFIFALFILRTPLGEQIFATVNNVVVALLGFTVQGASFIFGDLVWNNIPVGTGDPGTNAPMTPIAGSVARSGAFIAFNVLPTIIFFSSLMTLLYYLGVMQFAVKGMAWVMQRTMRTSGAETLSASGNIFLGQTEAPLLIKPFVRGMTMSELHCVMTGGFATVAGGVMAAYVGMLVFYFPDIAGHLLAASVMSAPAAIVFAKLMYPEKEVPETRDTPGVTVARTDANAIDAAARGASEGLLLAANVGAMLLAFIALIAVADALIGWVSGWTGIAGLLQSMGVLEEGQALRLQVIFGWALAPLAWLMGVPWSEATEVGGLLGIKTVVNEFVAYLELSSMLSNPATPLSPRSVIIATYALCGFANFSSIAIQIGGIGSIAPERRSDLARLGLRAMVAGTLAAFMTATIAGMLV
jgi:CNT family concentrative nucleoside transporter